MAIKKTLFLDILGILVPSLLIDLMDLVLLNKTSEIGSSILDRYSNRKTCPPDFKNIIAHQDPFLNSAERSRPSWNAILSSSPIARWPLVGRINGCKQKFLRFAISWECLSIRQTLLVLELGLFSYLENRGMILCYGCVQQCSIDEYLHYRLSEVLRQGVCMEAHIRGNGNTHFVSRYDLFSGH